MGKRKRAAGPFVPPGPTAEDLAEVAEAVRDAFGRINASQILPDTRPQPKSLTSDPPRSRIGSMAKPRTGSGKLKIIEPYAVSRRGKGRWRRVG